MHAAYHRANNYKPFDLRLESRRSKSFNDKRKLAKQRVAKHPVTPSCSTYQYFCHRVHSCIHLCHFLQTVLENVLRDVCRWVPVKMMCIKDGESTAAIMFATSAQMCRRNPASKTPFALLSPALYSRVSTFHSCSLYASLAKLSREESRSLLVQQKSPNKAHTSLSWPTCQRSISPGCWSWRSSPCPIETSPDVKVGGSFIFSMKGCADEYRLSYTSNLWHVQSAT